MKKIDVIVPVYDGLDETKACIYSVLSSNNQCAYELIAINDASPNPEIHAWLQEMAAVGKLTLLINEKNLGFVRTVNCGMRLHQDRDVILLNSDAVVANNWLDRMIHAADQDKKIASLTPFSNNAEICSFPKLCVDNALIEGLAVDEIDAVFRDNAPSMNVDIPTGVGFCMYIRRAALHQIGYFDEEAFGRGYGEENDFCMRSAAKGWRHALCTNVFVQHAGGVSFSSEKAARVENAMQILDQRYPTYHRDVHQHLQQDPQKSVRQWMQLHFLINNGRKKILCVTHDLGGGIQAHIDEVQKYFEKQADFIELKPAGNNSVVLEYLAAGYDLKLYFNLENEYEALVDVCRYLSISRVHYHHLMRVPEAALSLDKDLEVAMDVTLHDYYFINANPTLTDRNGVYVEDPDLRETECAGHYPIPEGFTLASWQERSAVLLGRAERVIAPCKATRDIYISYFPRINITATYHPENEAQGVYASPQVVPIKNDEKLRVAVIGAVSREKGADVFEHTACHKDPLDRLEYHLIGYAYKGLRETVIPHGAYNNHELDAIIERVNPHIIWFPAQWPETYCYVLSSAMKAGRPILSTNLGSFPERLAGRPLSYVQPWKQEPHQWKDILLQIRDWMVANSNSPSVDWPQVVPDTYFYRDIYLDYDFSELRAKPDLDFETIRRLSFSHVAIDKRAHSAKENLVVWLFHLRSIPIIRFLIGMVPFEVQRKIKRRLSHRPIHDILNERKPS